MRIKKAERIDLMVVCLIGLGMPTYYKVKYLLDNLIALDELLVWTALAEYGFAFVLAFMLVGINRYFRSIGQKHTTVSAAVFQLLALLVISEGVAIAFTYVFFNVIYPVGAPPSFLFDTALISLFVPFLVSGLSDRIFFINATKNAEEKAARQHELALAARYEALKARLSPHFLFNSLNTLVEIVESEPDIAVEFIENMATTYRYILEKRDMPTVPLDDELAAVGALLGLLETRHPGALDVSVNIAAGYKSAQVVPLALQTLIENILKHNQYSASSPLGVRIYTEGSELIVENKLQPREGVASTGTGLTNLNERLQQVHDKPLVVKQDRQRFQARLPLALEMVS